MSSERRITRLPGGFPKWQPGNRLMVGRTTNGEVDIMCGDDDTVLRIHNTADMRALAEILVQNANLIDGNLGGHEGDA